MDFISMYCRDSAANKDCTCIWKNDSKPQVPVDFTLLIPPSSSSFFLTFSFPNLHSSSESQITYFYGIYRPRQLSHNEVSVYLCINKHNQKRPGVVDTSDKTFQRKQLRARRWMRPEDHSQLTASMPRAMICL